MAGLMKGLFGGPKTATPSSVSDDADFADFARAPDPVPVSISPVPGVPTNENAARPTSISSIPYTKWYRVWERASPSDFYQEGVILPFIILIIGLHVWGRRTNKRKAKSWITAHGPVLEKEFAVVGFGGRRQPSIDDVQASGLLKAEQSDSLDIPAELLKEKTAQEYTTYASGRQNIAFVDIKLSLYKRYNPLTWFLEWALSFFFDSMRATVERMEATSYAFDGHEKDLIPVPSKHEQEALEARVKNLQSSYDGFVWAVVNKESMRQLRDDRYDISLTITKDHPKLPPWCTIMSESAEVTELLLTPTLIKAIEEAGDTIFEHLIVTDQPVEKPQKLNETIPRKRLNLSLRLPSSYSASAYASSLPLFRHFLTLPDTLVASAHFRSEVVRKIKATREDEVRKLKRVDEEEKAEERKLEGDRKKKSERENKLKVMSAEEQRKFLEKERERETKKGMKKAGKRG